MVFPNPSTIDFCTWLETSSYYRYSTARVANIAIIKAAAIAGTSVTNVQWNDFIRFTGINYPAYLEYKQFTDYPTTILNTYGSNLVQNGNFANDTVWTKGTGWTIADGVAHNISTASTDLYQYLTCTVGKIYELQFTVSNYQYGGCFVYSDSLGSLTSVTKNGTYQIYSIYANPYNLLIFAGLGGQPNRFDLSNVSKREVIFNA